MMPARFAEKFGPPCVAAMVRNGGFASVRLAQIALESAWGEATPHDLDTGKPSYNLTGVKGSGPAGSVLAWTHEVINGETVKVRALFRAYHSFEEHILERDKIFEWDNYDGYRAAKSPEAACWALQRAPMAYATDPNYADKLIAIIEAHGFERFDRWLWADVPEDHRFYDELSQMKQAGYLRGEKSDGRLGLSEEAIRVLVVAHRMLAGARS